jgi:hypothetical protein
MFTSFIIGLLAGIVLCLYFLVIVKQKKAKNNKSNSVNGQAIYLNFIILDKNEAVQTGVEQKIQDKMGRGYFRDKIAKKLGNNKLSNLYIYFLLY